MKISVIIPHMYGIKDADFHLKKCINSLVGHSEIVILANDGMGYGAAANEGLRLANGDHLVLMNNDMKIINGSLRDLITNNSVTVPDITPTPKDFMPRACFCIPRWIYEKVLEEWGYFYDEQFEVGYWEDDDLIYRLKHMNIPIQKIETIKLEHLNGGGLSMKQVGEQEFFNKNKERYLLKWNNENNIQ